MILLIPAAEAFRPFLIPLTAADIYETMSECHATANAPPRHLRTSFVLAPLQRMNGGHPTLVVINSKQRQYSSSSHYIVPQQCVSYHPWASSTLSFVQSLIEFRTH